MTTEQNTEKKFVTVPTQFPSITAYNPRMVLMHMDTLKDCVTELQKMVNTMEMKIVSLEEIISKQKSKKE